MKRILAAGGIVLSQRGELLMIFRRMKWELPKGHYELDEEMEACALREVREETGVKALDIVKFVGTTKHCYYDSYLQSKVVKETHWYEMRGDCNDQLIGQRQESIERVLWIPLPDLNFYLQDSYDNIVDILEKAGLLRGPGLKKEKMGGEDGKRE